MMVPVVDLAYSDGELNMGKSRLLLTNTLIHVGVGSLFIAS